LSCGTQSVFTASQKIRTYSSFRVLFAANGWFRKRSVTDVTLFLPLLAVRGREFVKRIGDAAVSMLQDDFWLVNIMSLHEVQTKLE